MNACNKPGVMWVEFLNTSVRKSGSGILYLTGVILGLMMSGYIYVGWTDKTLNPSIYNNILTDCFYQHYHGTPHTMLFVDYNIYNQRLIDDQEVNDYADELNIEIMFNPLQQDTIYRKYNMVNKLVDRYVEEYYFNFIKLWRWQKAFMEWFDQAKNKKICMNNDCSPIDILINKERNYLNRFFL